jgi:hypothetical protein
MMMWSLLPDTGFHECCTVGEEESTINNRLKLEMRLHLNTKNIASRSGRESDGYTTWHYHHDGNVM